jgi:transposase, IS30 family
LVGPVATHRRRCRGELRRNADGLGRYRATTAHALAYHRASRPKPGKLLTNLRLRGMVAADLAKKYSPGQIAAG